MPLKIHKDSHNISAGATFTIRTWLFLLGLMVYGMILVGGATRLTDSGLSITEWKPISGILPPMSDAEWKLLFEKYQQTAEYRLQNAGMSLAEFEYIYWWEWGHRFLGRLVGMFAVGGLAAFWLAGWLKRGMKTKLIVLVALGGLQGAIGWWMVASGIGDTDRVDVAPYRLMTHFGLALIILCYIYWLFMNLTLKSIRARSAGIGFYILFLLIFLQMAAGALVAGLDAGRTYTDWPMMAGEFVPTGYWMEALGVRNIFENVAAAQFNHRILAYVIVAFTLIMAIRYRRQWHRTGLGILMFLIALQVAWGIYTLMSAAPVSLALVHQGLGVLVMLASVRSIWRGRYSLSWN